MKNRFENYKIRKQKTLKDNIFFSQSRPQSRKLVDIYIILIVFTLINFNFLTQKNLYNRNKVKLVKISILDEENAKLFFNSQAKLLA